MGLETPVADGEVLRQLYRRSFLALTNPDKYVLLPRLEHGNVGYLVWEVGLPGPIHEADKVERNLLVMYPMGTVTFPDQYREAGEHFIASLNLGLEALNRRPKWWQFWN